MGDGDAVPNNSVITFLGRYDKRLEIGGEIGIEAAVNLRLAPELPPGPSLDRAGSAWLYHKRRSIFVYCKPPDRDTPNGFWQRNQTFHYRDHCEFEQRCTKTLADFQLATDPPVTVTGMNLGNATNLSVTVTVAYILSLTVVTNTVESSVALEEPASGFKVKPNQGRQLLRTAARMSKNHIYCPLRIGSNKRLNNHCET
ncbi:hypothetical protein C8R45DRAFT_931419 [Mycena sanguinolenta]|nr:hypothetical protein C8R45DRAFT_931419 [Mycena sanguinolenta]